MAYQNNISMASVKIIVAAVMASPRGNPTLNGGLKAAGLAGNQ